MSFTFNSVDFSTLGVLVESGFELPGATTRPVSGIGLPATSKVWYSQSNAEPIPIEFPVSIVAASPGALQTALDAINAALKTTTDKTLSYWYSDRVWMARWDGNTLRMPILNAQVVQTKIRFLAQPETLATSPVTSSRAIDADPMTIWLPGVAEITGVLPGNSVMAPIFTVFNNTGATLAASTLEVWNYLTGDYCNYTDTVPTGTYVRWDCDLRKCYTSPDNVTYTETLGKVTTNWLTIAGGAAGRIQIIGCATGTFYWTYRGRFL